MSADQRHGRACDQCLRSSWLLAALSDQLENHRRDYQSLLGLIELEPQTLIAAIGGADRAELHMRYRDFDRGQVARAPGVTALCAHDPAYPAMLAGLPGAPAVLYLAAPPQRLAGMLSAPTVAIVGSRYASAYGVEVAHALGSELASAGVTIVSDLAFGVAAAAFAGALDARGQALTVMPGGVDVCYPEAKRALYERLLGVGCVVSELPCGTAVQRWCFPARNRIVAALPSVMVVVEADDHYGALMLPALALAAGRDVAAVPGPITATAAQGTHALLADGAHLVRGAQDVLDLVCGAGARAVSCSPAELAASSEICSNGAHQ